MMRQASTSDDDAARPAGDIVRDFYDAFETGQASQALGLLSRDVVWVEAEGSPYGGESALKGRRAVWEGLLAPLAADWDGLEMLRDDLVEAGSAILVIGRYRGTHGGSGRRLDAQVAHLWEVQAGRIVRFRGFANTLAIAQARAR